MNTAAVRLIALMAVIAYGYYRRDALDASLAELVLRTAFVLPFIAGLVLMSNLTAALNPFGDDGDLGGDGDDFYDPC